MATFSKKEPISPSLNGLWTWRSYLVDPALPPAEPKAKLWAYGKLNASTDSEDRIEGELNFPPPPTKPELKLTLKVTGCIAPGKETTPAAFEATGKGIDGTPTAGAVYEIRGWFVPDPSIGDTKGRVIVRGSVMNTAPDLAKQPLRSVGTFFLEPETKP